MLALKKVYRDELLQFALLLSLLRISPDCYIETDLYSTIRDLDFDNGTSWRTFGTGLLRQHYVHPKSLDSVLLNYERQLFADLNSLGRYNPVHQQNQNITAYLLSIDRASVLNVNCTPEATETHSSEQPPLQPTTPNEDSLSANNNEAGTAFDVDLGLTQEMPQFI